MKPIATTVLVLVPSLASAPPQSELPRAGPREERVVRAGGAEYRADVGRVFVAEERAAKEPRAIEIAVARLRSTAAEPGAPIAFLVGGPADGATDMLGSELWAPYLELGDVLLIDTRGTGRSRPELALRPDEPAKLFGEREPALAALLGWARAAAEDARARGVDLAAYTTSAAADDVADVLAALGIARARVLAHSYGTHVALELLRRRPELVERAALLGVAGPDELLKPAGELEPFVRALARRAAADPEIAEGMPDVAAALARALERAGREPLRVRVADDEGAPAELAIGRFGLQSILLADLGDPSDLALFPRMLGEIERGETGLLAWFAEKRLERARSLPLAFYALRGSSGASAARRERIAADARSSPFGDARNFPFPEVLAPLGIRDAGDAFRAPVASAVPALLVSGTLDANTPPQQAEAALRTLSRGAHLVVENAGHDDVLLHPLVRERVVAFLAGDEPDLAPLALELPPFAPLAGPAPGATHPALAGR